MPHDSESPVEAGPEPLGPRWARLSLMAFVPGLVISVAAGGLASSITRTSSYEALAVFFLYHGVLAVGVASLIVSLVWGFRSVRNHWYVLCWIIPAGLLVAVFFVGVALFAAAALHGAWSFGQCLGVALMVLAVPSIAVLVLRLETRSRPSLRRSNQISAQPGGNEPASGNVVRAYLEAESAFTARAVASLLATTRRIRAAKFVASVIAIAFLLALFLTPVTLEFFSQPGGTLWLAGAIAIWVLIWRYTRNCGWARPYERLVRTGLRSLAIAIVFAPYPGQMNLPLTLYLFEDFQLTFFLHVWSLVFATYFLASRLKSRLGENRDTRSAFAARVTGNLLVLAALYACIEVAFFAIPRMLTPERAADEQQDQPSGNQVDSGYRVDYSYEILKKSGDDTLKAELKRTIRKAGGGGGLAGDTNTLVESVSAKAADIRVGRGRRVVTLGRNETKELDEVLGDYKIRLRVDDIYRLEDVPIPPARLASATPSIAAMSPRKGFRDCDSCPEMVVIPAGSFRMGSPRSESDRNDDEGPQYRVTLSRPFAAGKYEITFDEWDACTRETGCSHNPSDFGWGRGRQPVIGVSWNDAKEYVEWLSRKTGRSYQLLTEAQWEYAARAGTTTRYSFGDSVTLQQANFRTQSILGWSPAGQSPDRTMPVGSYAPNAFGLHDMHGNVSEWTEDCWMDSYKGSPADGTARTSGECQLRVLRGGDGGSRSKYLRSAQRRSPDVAVRISNNGFRVAATD